MALTIEELRNENEKLRHQVETLMKEKVHYRPSSTCCNRCDHIMFGRCDYLDAYVDDASICDMFKPKVSGDPEARKELTDEERMAQYKEFKKSLKKE